MAKNLFSNKRLQIDKSNTIMVSATAISAFIVVFSLFASKALLSQRSYQARVTTKKEQARDQLKNNIAAVSTLETAYKAFVGTSQNMIGGNPTGQGSKDGDNAKLVLDALPSKYDFPALTVSLNNIFTQKGITIGGISGTDDEIAQESAKPTNNPQPVTIPFTATVSGNYTDIQSLIGVLENSIRPIGIDSISFTGSDSALQVAITAKTYYQPEKDFSITTTEVK